MVLCLQDEMGLGESEWRGARSLLRLCEKLRKCYVKCYNIFVIKEEKRRKRRTKK